MRVRLLFAVIAGMALAAGAAGCAYPARFAPADPPAAAAAPAPAARAPVPVAAESKAPAAAADRVDFATQVQPILAARCQPCHFPGGKMYASLPFDRAETVLTLREKLFTRIKEEGEQRVLRQFLAQHPAPSGKLAATP
jgi:hypothetical protein